MTDDQTSPFHSVAKILLQNNIMPLPLIYGDKRPVPLKWTKLNREEVDAYISLPNRYNVGVILGKASGIIALDFDNGDREINKKLLAICGQTSVVKKGQKGGTLFFKYNGEVARKWKKGGEMILELLSDGNQTVLPPSLHPATKLPYTYTKGSVELLNAELLPSLPADFVERVNKVFDIKVEDVYEETTLKQVAEALKFIDSDASYDDWLMIGMALKNDFPNEGFAIWDEWSSSSKKYNREEMLSKYKSFNKDGYTIASVFKLAIAAGYEPAIKTTSLYNIRNMSVDLRRYREEMQGKQLSVGIKALDEKFHLRQREVTIVTGTPNSGKSEFLDFIIFNLVKNHNMKAMYVSFEKQIVEHIDSFIHRFSGKSMYTREIEDEVRSLKCIEDNLFFYDHTVNSRKIDDILNNVQVVHDKLGLQVLVVDPYSFLTKTYENEYANTNHTIIALHQFAKKNKLHIFLVAHPKTMASEKVGSTGERKTNAVTMYDVSGGANWFNTCDNAFIVHRDVDKVEIELAKIRRQERDSVGRFSLVYNKSARLYEDFNNGY